MRSTPDSLRATTRRREWQRAVYGDWSWFVRDPLDLLRLAFVVGTIAFALMGRSTAVGLTAASVLLLIARISNLPRWFDFSVIAAMTLIAWGTALGLYGEHFFYDNVVHSLSPFFYAPVLYIALVRLHVLADPEETTTAYSHAGVFVSTLALGMAVGAGYEVVEWLSDALAGTQFVKSIDDTGSDLLEDTLGSLAGATLVTVWSIRHWSSRRTTLQPVAAAESDRTAIQRVRRRLELTLHRERALPAWRLRLTGLPRAAKGTIGVAAGTVILLRPDPALRTVGIVFGLAMLAHAAVDIVEALRRGAENVHGGHLRVVGAELAVGALVIGWPHISRLALLYTIGASAVILALLEATSLSASARTDRERWLGGAASAAAFAIGVALLAQPHLSHDAIVAVIGLYLLILGALQLVQALEAVLARGRSERATVGSAPGTTAERVENDGEARSSGRRNEER